MRATTALTGLPLSLTLTAAASAQSASREILVSRFGEFPSVGVTGEGSFIVAWQSFGDSGEGVFARPFDANGQPTGPVLTVSDDFGLLVTEAPSRVPASAATAFSKDGSLIVVWDRSGATAEKSGMFLRRFTID